jgi:hypothetical protein
LINSSGVGIGRGTAAGDIGVAEVVGGDDWEKLEMPERAMS